MSYIGRGIDQIDNISTLDNLSFNGSLQTFNLTQNSVAFVPVSADALQIQIDGVIQSGNYTVSGSTVTFDFTPSGSSVCNGIRHYGVGVLTTVSDGAVTEAKIGSGAVTQTKVGDQAINEAKMQISNAPVNGYMLTAQSGNTGGLTWVEPGGGITAASQWRLTTSFSGVSSATPIASNWELSDTTGYGSLGSNMTESSGIFTFPSTGYWHIWAVINFFVNGQSLYNSTAIMATVNNSSYANATDCYTSINTSGTGYASASGDFIFDVTNTSTHKVRLDTVMQNNGTTVQGSSIDLRTGMTFIRLGDT